MLGKMHGHGFFVNAGNNEWVFGKFEDDECIEVIDGGNGIPTEDIGKIFLFRTLTSYKRDTVLFSTRRTRISLIA
jgi:hypothetical protein